MRLAAEKERKKESTGDHPDMPILMRLYIAVLSRVLIRHGIPSKHGLLLYALHTIAVVHIKVLRIYFYVMTRKKLARICLK